MRLIFKKESAQILSAKIEASQDELAMWRILLAADWEPYFSGSEVIINKLGASTWTIKNSDKKSFKYDFDNYVEPCMKMVKRLSA